MRNVRFARGVLLALAAATAVVLCLAGPAAARADDAYAAIAYSENTGKYGYSYGFDTRKAAEKKAIKECGAGDAKIVVWCMNSWCALATSDNGPYGWAYAPTEKEAKSIAMQKCRDAGGKNPSIAVSIFSGN